MKYIKKDQVQVHKNSESCTAFEYGLGDPDINGAVISLNGRYPNQGYVSNTVCKELVFVIDGTGTLTTDTQQQLSLAKGDMALLLPGERYYLEGTLTMLMPCSPAWYPEQHEIIV